MVDQGEICVADMDKTIKLLFVIQELLEQDIQNEQDKKMEGKSFTTKEQLIQPGETVEQFTKRVWGKQDTILQSLVLELSA